MEADAVVRLEIGPEVRLDVKDLVQHLRHELGRDAPTTEIRGDKAAGDVAEVGRRGMARLVAQRAVVRRELAVVAAVPVPDHHARIGVLLKRSNDCPALSRRR